MLNHRKREVEVVPLNYKKIMIKFNILKILLQKIKLILLLNVKESMSEKVNLEIHNKKIVTKGLLQKMIVFDIY